MFFDHLVFPGADVYTALVFLQKGEPRSLHKICVRKPLGVNGINELEKVSTFHVSQGKWFANESYRFETRLEGKLGDLVDKIRSGWPPLIILARVSLGCQAYNRSKHTPKQIAERVFHADNKAGEEYLPELAGKDVSRYEINRQKGKWIKYGPWLHDYRSLDWLQGPRILVREITGNLPYRIEACYIEDVYCNYKTILNINPSSSTNFSMKYLLGLLNSKLLSILSVNMSNKMNAQSFPRLSVGDLQSLPICNLDSAKPEDNAMHDEMVKLVQKMLDAHKRKQEIEKDYTGWLEHLLGTKIDELTGKSKIGSLDTLADINQLAELLKKNRKRTRFDTENAVLYIKLSKGFERFKGKLDPVVSEITETDRKIDRLVYKLYGLTDEEIGIVKGEAKPT